LIYRKDLFEDPKNRKEYKHRYQKDLTPPQTWDDFLNIATFFQRPERGLYGSVFAAYPDGHNAVFDFCLQVWTRGGLLTDTDGNVYIDSTAALQGLQFYRTLFCQSDCLHPDSSEMESVCAGAAFSRGEVSMMINWFGFAAFCELSENALVKGKIDVTAIPHGASGESASLNSYWMYMIGKGSSEKQLAYDFIKFATNRENDQLLTKEGGIGCRISTCNSDEINKIIPYFQKLKPLHENAKTLPGISFWPEIAAIIDDVMQKTIHTTDQIQRILKEGQVLINKIYTNHGY
ncbi:MAG TPA: extracellular solute-binding protein, partial [Chitinophagaceae bacterium]|nr:extracellular solute-binding protein [Chitinophagaceae bacterium]